MLIIHPCSRNSRLSRFAEGFEPTHVGCYRDSIPRHFVVDFIRPRRDAAFDTLEIFEALLPQEVERLQGTHSGFAVQIVLRVRIEFRETFVDLAQRQQRHAVHFRDLVFVRFTNVNDLDAEARIIQRLLHVLHGDFVGIADGLGGGGLDAAELIVINQLLDRRVVTTDRARGIATQLEFAELHVERVEEQQASDHGRAFAQREFQNLRRLNATDDAGQHAEDAAFCATRHHAGRRRFGIQTAVARAAEVRREHAGLALEPEDRAIDIRLLEQHAGVVSEIARREIVRAVHHDIVGADEIEGVAGIDRGVVDDHFDVRIDARDGFFGGNRFGATHIRVRVENLPLQIGIIHRVEIHDADLADARSGKIHRYGRAETARANAQDAGGFDLLLPRQTDFRQDQMPRVTADFFVVQLHDKIETSSSLQVRTKAGEIKSGINA